MYFAEGCCFGCASALRDCVDEYGSINTFRGFIFRIILQLIQHLLLGFREDVTVALPIKRTRHLLKLNSNTALQQP